MDPASGEPHGTDNGASALPTVAPLHGRYYSIGSNSRTSDTTVDTSSNAASSAYAADDTVPVDTGASVYANPFGETAAYRYFADGLGRLMEYRHGGNSPVFRRVITSQHSRPGSRETDVDGILSPLIVFL